MTFYNTALRKIFSKELRSFWIFEIFYITVIIIVNIWADEFDLYFRWFFIGDITPYNLVPAILVTIMGAFILYKNLTDRYYINYLYFSLGLFFLGLFFFWTWYVDMTVIGDGRVSVYNDKPIGYSNADWVRSYSILLVIGAVFIVLWFLHFEYLYRERVFSRRLITILVGVIPAATLFYNKRVTENYTFSQTYFENLTFVMYLIMGLGFFSIIATYSILQGRMSFQLEELRSEVDTQVAYTIGILQGMFLFAVVEGFKLIYNNYISKENPINISMHAPITITIFMIPLVYLYLKNPSYLTILATPVYEVLIIDMKTSMNIWAMSLREGEHTKTNSSLKVGLLTSTSMIFEEIIGVETYVKKVELLGYEIVMKKFTLDDGKDILLALNTSRKSRYLDQIVNLYISELIFYFNQKDLSDHVARLSKEDIKQLEELTARVFNLK